METSRTAETAIAALKWQARWVGLCCAVALATVLVMTVTIVGNAGGTARNQPPVLLECADMIESSLVPSCDYEARLAAAHDRLADANRKAQLCLASVDLVPTCAP